MTEGEARACFGPYGNGPSNREILLLYAEEEFAEIGRVMNRTVHVGRAGPSGEGL